jgi:hypothetical protein
MPCVEQIKAAIGEHDALALSSQIGDEGRKFCQRLDFRPKGFQHLALTCRWLETTQRQRTGFWVLLPDALAPSKVVGENCKATPF